MKKFLLISVWCIVVVSCDTEDHYDAVYVQGGAGSTSRNDSYACSVGDSQRCVTANGLDGLQYCFDDRSRFGLCWPTASSTIISSGGTTSQTTSITTPTSVGGATSSSISSGVANSSCISGSQIRCTTSSGQSGYRTCLVSQWWSECVMISTSSCTDCDGDGSDALHDCNDQNASVYPSRTEICDNGIDDDCNAKQDCTDPACLSLGSCHIDADGDGEYATTDCNDQNASVSHNRSELCSTDGIDEDCDGFSDCEDADCRC